MKIVARGYSMSLNKEEENFVNKIIDFVDNLEKEIFAFHTMINDFFSNVDNNQKGAQRLCIYLLLDRVRKSKYYDSIESYKELYCKFRDVCNPIERLFLRMWNQASVSSPQYKRAGNILQHLFKL